MPEKCDRLGEVERAAPQQQNKCDDHHRHPERNKRQLRESAGDNGREVEGRERCFFPRPESAPESVGGEEGDGGGTIMS